MSDEGADTAIYKAVVNDEEQYSIWPAERELPPGWRDAGMEGLKPEVLAWIEQVWTAMRRDGLRQEMDGADAEDGEGHPS